MLHLLLAVGVLLGEASATLLPVNLLSAGNYVILAKSGVSTTGTTAITGNLGISPIATTAYTGFGLKLASTGQYATSSIVTGFMYAADMAAPTPSVLTTAIGDMGTAYTDAAGRTLPNFSELGAGDISGLTLAPGLYKWSTTVLINSGVTIQGSATDVWIFQIAQGLTMASSTSISLTGGAQAANIFWQVAGQTTIGTGAHFEGTILCATAVVMNTGASLNGHILAQTAVTLDGNTIVASIQTTAGVTLSTTLVSYVILAEAGVGTSGVTNIVGNLGLSPATSTAYTGFGTLSATGPYATSTSVTGRLYAADMAAPTPAVLAAAIVDMKAAYASAAALTPPDFFAVGGGAVGGMTLTPGVYKWTTSVAIGANVTLQGGANSVWVFQIAGALTMSNGTMVVLTQGAQAANVAWQVAGTITIGPQAQFQGIILCASAVTLQTQATFNGRIMSQTTVTLNAAAVNAGSQSTPQGTSRASPATGPGSLLAAAVAALLLSVSLAGPTDKVDRKPTAASTPGATPITGSLRTSPIIVSNTDTGFGPKIASNGQYATAPAVTGDL